MNLHIVLMAPRTGMDQHLMEKAELSFQRIRKECEGIERFELVKNHSLTSPQYTHALISVFSTPQALDAYRASPAHAAMMTTVGPHIEHIVVLDSVLQQNLIR